MQYFLYIKNKFLLINLFQSTFNIPSQLLKNDIKLAQFQNQPNNINLPLSNQQAIDKILNSINNDALHILFDIDIPIKYILAKNISPIGIIGAKIININNDKYNQFIIELYPIEIDNFKEKLKLAQQLDIEKPTIYNRQKQLKKYQYRIGYNIYLYQSLNNIIYQSSGYIICKKEDFSNTKLLLDQCLNNLQYYQMKIRKIY